jgi:hypothetical protein
MRGVGEFRERFIFESRQDVLVDKTIHELAAAAVGEQDSLWIGRHSCVISSDRI